MEFWGCEVKPGEPLKVQPEFGKLIHISQAALGEVKDVKGAKHVPLRLKVDSKDFVIGFLSAEDRTQLMLDLVFEREFEISHDCKNGSVYFIGYIADDPVSDGEDFSEFDDDSEDEPLEIQENGKIKPESGIVKAAAAAAKAGTKKEEQSDSDEDEDDSDDSDDEMAFGEEDSSDVSGEDSDDDEDEEEELPKQSKKRPAESAKGTPATKKAKSATPDKTGNKKGATPTPPKSGGQTPKSGGQTPKSGGQPSRKPFNKPFNSDKAPQSRGKAKHGRK